MSRSLFAIGVGFLLGSGAGPLAQETTPATNPDGTPGTVTETTTPTTETTGKKSSAELESLVAPIALYADDLLAQTLVAATYPLEMIQLQQWLAKRKDLEGEALADSVGKQAWDPSIKSMAAVPEVVDRLANDIEWTTELGNAFLAQQSEVMDAVQRMRKKATNTGALATNEQQKVETTVVQKDTIIVVQPANPEVIYVPTYSPVVVYGPPPVYYPYPPIYYPPPPPPGAAMMAFTMGVMWGAAYGGSCCGCGWGGNDVYINVNNNYNVNRGGGGNTWQHNPAHRGSAPYNDRATATKYGGSSANRASAGTSNRTSGGASTSNRGSSGQGPSASPSVNQKSKGGSGTGSGAGASKQSSATKTGGSGTGSGASASKQSSGTKTGGSDKIGNQSISKSSGTSSAGGFGASQSKGSAQASRSRGASSMGGRRSAGGRGK